MKKKHGGWTRTHVLFLIMGGFTLHEEGKPVWVLEAKELEQLSEVGKIEWPMITEEEIVDRSKGDYLSKTIVLLQTTWFIIQCIARGVSKLPLTQLEVVTIAFASFTGIIYFYWWDKPLDVRCSVPVHLLPGRLQKNEGVIEKEDTGSQIIPPPELSDQEIREGDKVVVISNSLPVPSTPVQIDTSAPDPALTSTGSHLTSLYSPPPDDDDDDDIVYVLVVCVATAFGAIHCLAWSFHFATLRERWVWRISAIVVTGWPAFALAFVHFLPDSEEKNKTPGMQLLQDIGGSILCTTFCLYCIARLVLLVLPFTTLHELPPGAYTQFNWADILPHI